MSHFFNGAESTPVEAGHGLHEDARSFPDDTNPSSGNDGDAEHAPLSPNSSTSSASYRIAKEKDGEEDMTEDEVKNLVSNALRRARRATTPKTSPRGSPKPVPMPSSPGKSPTNTRFPENLASFDSLEGSYPNHREELHAAELLQSLPPPESSAPDARLSAKTKSEETAKVTTTTSDMDEGPDGPPATSDGTSRSASNDVIRRVEEEIANAKKAAEEAQQKLAYALSSHSSNSWSIDKPVRSPSMELDELLDNELADHAHMLGILNVLSGEDPNDDEKRTEATETSFRIAREMIGEEFNGASPAAKEDWVTNVDSADGHNAQARATYEATVQEDEKGVPAHAEEDRPPSEISDFLGNVDETDAYDAGDGRAVDLVKDGSPSSDVQVNNKVKEIDDGPDGIELKARSSSSFVSAAVEEKKSESPTPAGPWNGFLSALIGTTAAGNMTADSANAIAPDDPETEALVSTSSGSQNNRPLKVEESVDRGIPDTVKTNDAVIAQEVENASDTSGRDSKPAVTTPWWTSPNISAVSEHSLGEKMADGDASEAANANGVGQGTAQVEEATSSKPSDSNLQEERETSQGTERESETLSQSRQVEFKEPYPPPPPLPKPRPAEEIIKDNQIGVPQRVVRWTDPKPQLQELLLASKGDSLARRSNALGALKVLSLKKKNQLTLARTRGFLESVVIATNAAFPPEDRELALVARARAVVTLLHVSEPKDNRIIVCGHPGLLESLVRVIEDDSGEARAHACGALAMLAKTASNREPMVKVGNLVTMLGCVVRGTGESLTLVETNTDLGDEDDQSHDGSETSAFSADDSAPHSDGGSSAGSSYSESSTKPVEEIGGTVEKNNSIQKTKEGMQNEFETCSRYNACAALAHLSKHCAISSVLCENKKFLESMMAVSIEFDIPFHTKCLEILCNLTRFPSNNEVLAHVPTLVDTFVSCGKSKSPQDRVWAMRALQNLASDSSSKVILATKTILTLLSVCAVRNQYDEQVAAVATLYNLSTDAGAVVSLTNTRNVVATLVHLAHNSNTPPDVRQMSCDALATIGLWLQTLASAGKAPAGQDNVKLPSHTTAGWERWD